MRMGAFEWVDECKVEVSETHSEAEAAVVQMRIADAH